MEPDDIDDSELRSEVEYYMEHPIDISTATLEDILNLPFMDGETARKIIKVKTKKEMEEILKDSPYREILKRMLFVNKKKFDFEIEGRYSDGLEIGARIEALRRYSGGVVSAVYRENPFEDDDISASLWLSSYMSVIIGDFRVFSNTGLSFAGRSSSPRVYANLNRWSTGVFPFLWYPTWRKFRGIAISKGIGIINLSLFGAINPREGEVENDTIKSFLYYREAQRFYEYSTGGIMNLKLGYGELGLIFNRFYYEYPVYGEKFDFHGKELYNISLNYSIYLQHMDFDFEVVKGRGYGLCGKMDLRFMPFLTGVEMEYAGDTLFTPYGIHYGMKERESYYSISHYFLYSGDFIKTGFDLKFSDTLSAGFNMDISTSIGHAHLRMEDDYFSSSLYINLLNGLRLKLVEKYESGSFVYGGSFTFSSFLKIRGGAYIHSGEHSMTVYIPSFYPFSSGVGLDEDEYITFISIAYTRSQLIFIYPNKEILLKISFSF